ncbi:hypothetical protein Tco_0394464 [Tanacetum coccineum]
MMDNRGNRRLDVFGASVISRKHRVLCDLGFTFHYLRRRSNWNRRELELIGGRLEKAGGWNNLRIDRFDLDEPGVSKLSLIEIPPGFGCNDSIVSLIFQLLCDCFEREENREGLILIVQSGLDNRVFPWLLLAEAALRDIYS